MERKIKIKKVLRYIKIYGISRTLTKIVGRLRLNIPFHILLSFPNYNKKGKTVGIIGCGHQSYSSLAYYLTRLTNYKFIWAYDIDENAVRSLSVAYGIKNKNLGKGLDEYIIPDIVYIASNHATHTDYAVQFIDKGCDVYIEKPISINQNQFKKLTNAIEKSNSNIYVGYNRPFSKAIKLLRSYYDNPSNLPFTLNCYVIGHLIPDDHWYRDPKEGSRIVSNLGHWIDLFVHIYYWTNRFPKYLDININYSNENQPSDNISVNIVSPGNDLISLVFSTRNDPFEGVNETINFQCGELNSKINDFREIEIWKESKYLKKTFFTKDNGHKASAIQPKLAGEKREWAELKTSTRVMLFIEEMANSKIKNKRFNF